MQLTDLKMTDYNFNPPLLHKLSLLLTMSVLFEISVTGSLAVLRFNFFINSFISFDILFLNHNVNFIIQCVEFLYEHFFRRSKVYTNIYRHLEEIFSVSKIQGYQQFPYSTAVSNGRWGQVDQSLLRIFFLLLLSLPKSF